MSTTNKNTRLAKNTLMLYIRMFITMAVSLYTSRVILAVLGVEDFGIYNIIGGVVATFSTITTTLSGAISRFITYELGKGDKDKLKKIFITSVNIQILISVLVFIFAEILGVWFLNNKMNIPVERIIAANYILQFSIVTFIISLLTIPFNALIIAYERMDFYAYISIFEVILKLTNVYFLLIISYDKLIVYGLLMMLTSLLIVIIYFGYCHKNFKECRYSIFIDKSQFKGMMNFAGWNFLGSTAGVLRNQGVDIIINLFFGVTINAARGIANQVSNAVSSFSQNFITALKPQITKSYAENDFKRLFFLIEKGSRFSFYLFMIVTLPLFFELEIVFSIWLEEVPDYAVLFTRLLLILCLLSVLSQPLISTLLSTGKIRNYQISVGGISLMCFPLSYLVLLLGGSPESTYIVIILIEVVCLFVRLIFVKNQINFRINDFFVKVIFNVIQVLLLSSIVPFLIINFLPGSILRLLITILTSITWSILVILYVGLNVEERFLAYNKIRNKFLKKFKDEKIN